MSLPRRALEIAAFVLLLAACAFTRLYDLGAKPIMHDEALFLYYSWFQLHESLTYVYEPILHGPLELWLQAAAFRLFGGADWVARLVAGVSGVGGFFWVWAMRRWLGEVGVWVALAFYTVSTSLMFYQRFFRQDDLFLFLTLWAVASAAHWWHSRRPGWMVSFLLACVAMFCNKESSVFVYFTLATFFLIVLIDDFVPRANDEPVVAPRPQARATVLPRPVWVAAGICLGAFLVWTRVFEGIRYDSDVVEALGRDFLLRDVRSLLLVLGWLGPVEEAGLLGRPGFWRMVYVAVPLAALGFGFALRRAVARGWGNGALVRGLWADLWRARYWILGACAFGFFVYQFLFSTAFKFPRGPFEFYHRTLAYWMGQHAMHRLEGPFHMHMVNMAIYETPQVLLVLAAWGLGLFRGAWRRPTAVALFLVVLAFAFFHLWVFRGLESSRMLYFRHLAQVGLLAGLGLWIWPRAGRFAWPALAVLFVVFSVGYFQSAEWKHFLHAPAWRGGRELAPTGLKLIDDSLSLTHGMHLFLIAFLVLFGTVETWRAVRAGRRFHGFCLWWLITTVGAASYAREKVPWVGIHIALPLVCLAGTYAQQAFAWARHQRLPVRRAAWVAGGLVLAAGLTANGVAAWRACFVHPGDVRERISCYAETPIDLKRHADALRELAATGASAGLLTGLEVWGHDPDPFDPEWEARHPGTVRSSSVRVLIANEDVIWPMRWYLKEIPWQESRDLEQDLRQDWEVVLVRSWDAGNEALSGRYLLVRGRARMHWLGEPANYGLLPEVWRALVPWTTSDSRENDSRLVAASRREWYRLWRYWSRREIDLAASQRPSVVEYVLGVRRDLVSAP
jgi:predicted membrane-bound mannosyltransferase